MENIDETQIKKDCYAELEHSRTGIIIGILIMAFTVFLFLMMTAGENGMPAKDAKWIIIGGGGLALFLMILDAAHNAVRKPKFDEKKRLLESAPVKGEIIEIREYQDLGLNERQIPLGSHCETDENGNVTRRVRYKNRVFRILVKYYDRSQYSDMYMLSRGIPFRQPDVKVGGEVEVYLSGDGKATMIIPGVDKK